MSRIGKMSIALPQGVDVKCENSLITVKGPKGTLTREMKGAIEFKTENGHLTLVAQNEEKETGALHGLYRALVAGMVKGVSEGYSKALEVKGVGWRAAMQGNKLVLNVGFSHPVEVAQQIGRAHV